MLLILSTEKRTSELSFFSRFKIHVLYASKLLDLLFAIKKVSFLLSRKFSIIKEILHNQGIFPQSRKFSTIKGFFHGRGNFSSVKNISANKDQKGSLKANT